MLRTYNSKKDRPLWFMVGHLGLLFSRSLALTRYFWLWTRINRNPWRKPSDLRNLQEKMFKSVLKHAYENTAFYHRLYRQHGVRPDDIKSLDDVRRLPIVSKQDLRQCSVEERLSTSYDIGRCSQMRTSGSTGEPFTVYLEPFAMSYLRALSLRRLFVYGYRPWYTIMNIGPFWAEPISTLKRRAVRSGFLNLLDAEANHLSLLDDPHENIPYLRAINPDVIWSPPSYLRLLAQAVRKLGVEDVRPRIIISSAEMLDRPTRALIESTFGAKVFDEYGAADVASRALAWQCAKREGYHINMDALYMEFVKNGEPVSAGEEGYIVATSLFRYATPTIRYMIGDVGIPSGEPCSCGRTFPLMKSLVGRSDDFLVMPDGRLVSPLSAIALLGRGVPGVQRYQIVQEKIDKIVVFIEPVNEWKTVEENVRSRCSKFFGGEVQLEIVSGPITIVMGRKHRVVTSKVPAALKKLCEATL